MDKSTISMAIFNSKLFVYQGVPHFRHTLFFQDQNPWLKPNSELWHGFIPFLTEKCRLWNTTIHYSWLVVSNMTFIFRNIWDNPSHWRTHIFQDGYCTTNQIAVHPICPWVLEKMCCPHLSWVRIHDGNHMLQAWTLSIISDVQAPCFNASWFEHQMPFLWNCTVRGVHVADLSPTMTDMFQQYCGLLRNPNHQL